MCPSQSLLVCAHDVDVPYDTGDTNFDRVVSPRLLHCRFTLSPFILVCFCCCNKLPKIGSFINNKNLFVIVLEAGSPRSVCEQGRFYLRSLSLACKWPYSPLGSHVISSVFDCVLIFSSYKDISHIGLGPTHITSFYPSYLLKGPVSKFSHILRYLGVRTST